MKYRGEPTLGDISGGMIFSVCYLLLLAFYVGRSEDQKITKEQSILHFMMRRGQPKKR